MVTHGKAVREIRDSVYAPEMSKPKSRYFSNKLQDYSPGLELDIVKDKWLDQIVSLIKAITDAVPTVVSSDGGLYVGSAGVAYMLCYAADYEPLHDSKITYLHMAKSLYDRDLKFTYKEKSSKADEVSFLLGPAGIYALGIYLGNSLKNENLIQDNIRLYKACAKECLKPKFLSCGSDELFVGRAGYLCGALTLEKKFGTKILDDATINDICATMVRSGKEFAQRFRTDAPLLYAYYDTVYLGAAHGISSILQMILSCPSFLESNRNGAQDVRQAVDWLLSLQQPNGNFAPALDEVSKPRPEKEELVHWCHGAPGIVYLFAKAYLIWRDERYLQACLKCGELTWQKGLLTKGPGICHGIAGSGYVFLLLYRLTKDKKHLHRAQQFANFLFTDQFQSGARTPDSPYSLYEGLAGTVCFLLDLIEPEKAAYPFFEVF